MILSADFSNVYFNANDWKSLAAKKPNNFEFQFQAGQFLPISDLSVSAGNTLFGVIFGCDILYETEHYADIVRVLVNSMEQNGVALIFSKMFYYGNTGSVYEFLDFVNASNLLRANIIKHLNDKIGGNTRAIIEITHFQKMSDTIE